MAALKISISRCSSQDRANRVENILSRDKGKWLSNTDNTSSRIEAEIQLPEATKIAFINIGNAGSAFIEILAGNSLWPCDKDYVTLLASTMLMSPADSKAGKNKEGVKMFDKDSFVKGIADGEWDRLRIIIRQPYTGKKQYGLHFIDIIADDKLTNNDTSPVSEKSKTSSRQSLAAFKSKLQAAPLAASSSSGSHLSSPSSRAAGLVKAAQLNLNQVKQKPREESRHKKHHKAKRNSPYKVDAQLQRRKSLSRRTAGDIEDEVECFLEAFDFEKLPLESITYRNLRENMEEVRGSKLNREEKRIFIKLAKKHVQDVLDKRNETEESLKNPTVIDLSSPKSSKSSSPIQSPTPLPKSSVSPPPSPATPPLKSPAQLTDFTPNSLQECPLCEKFFPLLNIEFHASTCVGATTRETIVLTSPTRDSETEEVKIQEVHSPVKTACDLGSSDIVPCPICNCWFPESRINVHANFCAEAGLLVSF